MEEFKKITGADHLTVVNWSISSTSSLFPFYNSKMTYLFKNVSNSIYQRSIKMRNGLERLPVHEGTRLRKVYHKNGL